MTSGDLKPRNRMTAEQARAISAPPIDPRPLEWWLDFIEEVFKVVVKPGTWGINLDWIPARHVITLKDSLTQRGFDVASVANRGGATYALAIIWDTKKANRKPPRSLYILATGPELELYRQMKGPEDAG